METRWTDEADLDGVGRILDRLGRVLRGFGPWDVVLAVLVALTGLALDKEFVAPFVLTCVLLPLAKTLIQPTASLIALACGVGYSVSGGDEFQPWLENWSWYTGALMWCLPVLVAGWYVGRRATTGWSLLVVTVAALAGTTPPVATPLPTAALLLAYLGGRLWADRDQRLGLLSRQLGAARQQVQVTRDEKLGLQERNELARDLHDVIGHHLSVISLSTEAAFAQPDTTDTALGQIRSATHAAMNELDILLHSLRQPGEAAELEPYKGLNDVPELLESLRQAEIQADGQVMVTTAVSDGLQLAAFRIIQETVTNILRHARATRASVLVTTSGKLLVMEISDDGVGFDREAVSRGRGLVGIEERVRSFSGEWSTRASAWGGTTVRVELPLTGGTDQP